MTARIRFIFIAALLGIITLFVLPIQALLLKLRSPLARKLPMVWHGLALRLIGMRVKVKGAPVSDRPLMIIANHTSWTDIPVLGSLVEVCFIAKQEVDEMPGAGLLARMQRTVFVKREEKRAVGKQVDAITERLVNGDAMVLFGEGSTGNGSHVGPFKSSLLGAAQYAVASGAVDKAIIQPVSIAYTGLHGIPLGHVTRARTSWCGIQELTPHAIYILLKSAWDVEVRFGEPMEFTNAANRRKLAVDTRQRVREMFVSSIHKRDNNLVS